MRRRTRGKIVRRCPHCRSTRLVFEGGLILGQLYHCLDCDYVGPLVVEEEVPVDSSPRSP
jgi:hypothetical protein